MIKSFFLVRSIAFLFAALALFDATQANAVQRTHVSAAIGSDANTATNCAAAAPCRFFQAALTVTDNNGEVIVLDSGGYGAVTITQSVALIAPAGVYAGISVFPGSAGVTIGPPTVNINVVLRGITINGQGGNNGIFINASATSKLSVENCVISNMAANGIYALGSSDIRIVDSTFRSNAQHGIYLFGGVKATITRAIVSASGSNGIRIDSSVAASSSLVDIADTTVDATAPGSGNANGNGIYATSNNSTATVRVAVRDSRVVRNANFGMFAESNQGGLAQISVSNNIVSNNLYGIAASGAGSKAIVSGNTVTSNLGSGFLSGGSIFETAGNNIVRDNGANIGAITVIATQ